MSYQEHAPRLEGDLPLLLSDLEPEALVVVPVLAEVVPRHVGQLTLRPPPGRHPAVDITHSACLHPQRLALVGIKRLADTPIAPSSDWRYGASTCLNMGGLRSASTAPYNRSCRYKAAGLAAQLSLSLHRLRASLRSRAQQHTRSMRLRAASSRSSIHAASSRAPLAHACAAPA